MRTFLKFSTLIVVGFVFFACGKERTREEKASAIINKIDSPFVVMSMTPQNLMDKSGILDGVFPFTYELILAFFIDESVTGIDYSVKTQVVVGNGESFMPSYYVIFKIKDQAKFKELIEKEANATVVEKEGMNTAIKESDGYAVAWNEEFAILSNIPIDIFAMLSGKGGQGDKTVNKIVELIKAAEEGEPNETYTEFLNKPADISVYYDGKGMFSYMKSMMGEASEDIEKMKESMEGLSAELFLNFSEGEIKFELINHLSEKLKTDLAFIQEKGINSNLLKYGNGREPFLVGSYNINFEQFFSFVETQAGEDGLDDMEEELELLGLTIADVKKALSGEFIYMIDGITEVTEVYDYGYGEPYEYKTTMPIFGVALGINNLDVVNVLLADSLKLPNGTYKMGDGYVCLNGNVLFASNDSSWTNKVFNNVGTSINQSKDLLTSHPLAMFIDFGKLAEMSATDDEAKQLFSVFNQFNGFANIDGGTFTITLNDKSKNALRILTEIVANELEKSEKEMNQEIEDELEEAVLEGLDGLEEELNEVQEKIEQ